MALPRLETPIYELTLPSTGKKIKFRPFLVKEHKVLLTLSDASAEEVSRTVNDLVDVCTFNKLNVDDLPHFDIEYIFMNLRAKSIGEAVDVVITCGNCGTKYDHQFNIDTLKIEKNNKISNKIMLTDKIGIELKFPNFGNVVKIFESEDTNDVFDLVKNCIVGVFDGDEYFDAKEQTNDEINDFIYSLTKKQFDSIEQFFKYAPKIVQEFDSECPQCKTTNKSRIEGLQNFFI